MIVVGVIMVMIMAVMSVVVVVIVVGAGVVAIVVRQEMRIDFGDAVEIERAKAHNAVERDVAALHLVKASRGVDLADGALDGGEFVL